MVQRLNQGINEDQAKIDELQRHATKEAIDGKRKLIARAKIVLSSGVTLLPPDMQELIARAALGCLIERDRDLLIAWFKDKGIDLTAAAGLLSLTVGYALMRVVAGMGEGNLELLATEILGHATGEDREVLEAWFAALATNRKRHDNATVSASVQP